MTRREEMMVVRVLIVALLAVLVGAVVMAMAPVARACDPGQYYDPTQGLV